MNVNESTPPPAPAPPKRSSMKWVMLVFLIVLISCLFLLFYFSQETKKPVAKTAAGAQPQTAAVSSSTPAAQIQAQAPSAPSETPAGGATSLGPVEVKVQTELAMRLAMRDGGTRLTKSVEAGKKFLLAVFPDTGSGGKQINYMQGQITLKLSGSEETMNPYAITIIFMPQENDVNMVFEDEMYGYTCTTKPGYPFAAAFIVPADSRQGVLTAYGSSTNINW